MDKSAAYLLYKSIAIAIPVLLTSTVGEFFLKK